MKVTDLWAKIKDQAFVGTTDQPLPSHGATLDLWLDMLFQTIDFDGNGNIDRAEWNRKAVGRWADAKSGPVAYMFDILSGVGKRSRGLEDACTQEEFKENWAAAVDGGYGRMKEITDEFTSIDKWQAA